MYFSNPHSVRRLRAWLIAAAAILLLTSILEAGHAHDTYVASDDHCALCQHSLAFALSPDCTLFVLPLLLGLLLSTDYTPFVSALIYRFALIRAPPLP